jgi:hypothetical protein
MVAFGIFQQESDMDYEQHYLKLFQDLESEFGKLDVETITSIIGFSAGGPVSMCKQSAANLFVTCELSCYSEQQLSTEHLKFELFSVGNFNEQQSRDVFTALGNLSMSASLGDNHTVDISTVDSAPVEVVRLHRYSDCNIDGRNFGLYRVQPGQKS